MKTGWLILLLLGMLLALGLGTYGAAKGYLDRDDDTAVLVEIRDRLDRLEQRLDPPGGPEQIDSTVANSATPGTSAPGGAPSSLGAAEAGANDEFGAGASLAPPPLGPPSGGNRTARAPSTATEVEPTSMPGVDTGLVPVLPPGEPGTVASGAASQPARQASGQAPGEEDFGAEVSLLPPPPLPTGATSSGAGRQEPVEAEPITPGRRRVQAVRVQ